MFVFFNYFPFSLNSFFIMPKNLDIYKLNILPNIKHLVSQNKSKLGKKIICILKIPVKLNFSV